MIKRISMVFAVVVAFVSFSFGNGSSSGLVTAIDIESGVVMFKAGEHRDYPAQATCSAQQSDEWGTWTFSLSTDDGKAKLALLLYAHQNNLELVVGGNGQCDVWGDRETAQIIRLKH